MKGVRKIVRNAQIDGTELLQATDEFLHTYRNTSHPSTGFSPNQLIFKHNTSFLPHVKRSSKLYKQARRNDWKHKKAMAKKWNKKFRARSHIINEGDSPLLKIDPKALTNKFQANYEAIPLIITRVKGSMITGRRRDGSYVTRNCSLFKKFQGVIGPVRLSSRTRRAPERYDQNKKAREML